VGSVTLGKGTLVDTTGENPATLRLVIGRADPVRPLRLPRGKAGGLARVRTAWRYGEGTFMPESGKFEAYRQEYERHAERRAFAIPPRAKGARRTFSEG
jgi:hypothetical protein